MSALTVGSLFSGIGGLDLGLERAGMEVRWQAEVDPYCSRVLAKHWPSVPNLGDVTKIDWSDVERVDLICGGYPCQPFSTAGKRLGATDARHLWPYFRDALRALRPRFALLENVRGHFTLGFPDVLADLDELGFDAEWTIVPASWLGAPHRRDRLFVVAYSQGVSFGAGFRESESGWIGRRRFGDSGSSPRDVADSAVLFRDGGDDHTGGGGACILTSTEPRDGRGDARAGISGWAVEPDVGRVAHGVPHRVDRLRALGNAVVPQVAEWIGRQLLDQLDSRRG